jgi:hypothetical protein
MAFVGSYHSRLGSDTTTVRQHSATDDAVEVALAILNHFSPRHREALIRFYLHGAAPEETGIDPEEFRVLRALAREQVREALIVARATR